MQHASFNPLTATLVASSLLGKRPIEIARPETIKAFHPFARARERTCIKMHSTESRLVTGPLSILFAGVYVSIFQPGNFTGWGSEWG